MYQYGYLAFLRLVGTVYFKKHCTGFDTSSPSAYFQTFQDASLTVLQQHSAWLDSIRQNIWYRVKFENEMIPSDEALLLHWKRTCWIIDMQYFTSNSIPRTYPEIQVCRDSLVKFWSVKHDLMVYRKNAIPY